jgi:hypothetical protein
VIARRAALRVVGGRDPHRARRHIGEMSATRVPVTLSVVMLVGGALEAWEFGPASDLGDVVVAAAERRMPPSFAGRLLSTHGDALTLQVIAGSPSGDPRALYYVRGHGAFVLARREEWPALDGGRSPRVLVTLLAFPRPQTCVEPRHG